MLQDLIIFAEATNYYNKVNHDYIMRIRCFYEIPSKYKVNDNIQFIMQKLVILQLCSTNSTATAQEDTIQARIPFRNVFEITVEYFASLWSFSTYKDPHIRELVY